MNAPMKLVITSKKNLKSKYGKNFSKIEKLLGDLVTADIKRNLNTKIIYLDEPTTLKEFGLIALKSITRQSVKKLIDQLSKKLNPAYIVIFGSQDIIPMIEIINPANDDDSVIPSDLPYACDAPYGTNIKAFIGPTRVVGRIPDIPGIADFEYVNTVMTSIINFKQVTEEKLVDYFAVSAAVWKGSTKKSITNIFGNSTKLKISPPAATGYSATDLSPLSHFYNCHGSPIDPKYYGQKDNNYPTAQFSNDINGKISIGTIVAAECCYGIELYDPSSTDENVMSIANMYFKNKAAGFVGSSTIAYGPSDGQGLADLLTQYFMKSVISGASTGRALLEARQKFLTESGPQLDPYELKTFAQFYLLGDPSLQPLKEDTKFATNNSVENRRLNLYSKGLTLASSISPSERVENPMKKGKKSFSTDIKNILKEIGFTGDEEEVLYEVKTKNKKVNTFAKTMSGQESITFRALIKKPEIINNKIKIASVLVLKENGKDLLGWRLYHRK